MIRYLAQRWLRAFSQRYHYDTHYMTDILNQSSALFLKFGALNLLSAHRRGLPGPPWWTARIRAALAEDCGPCAQLMCSMAMEDGLDPTITAAIVASDIAALDADCALALQFTECVLARNPEADRLREQVRMRWGEAGLISLAMTISTTRVYPTVKYVLGHGTACHRIQIAQRNVAPTAFVSATIADAATTGIAR